MYAIKWTRCTGETGIFATRFRSSQRAANAACQLRCIAYAKGRANEMDYEIIEIGNSAK